jgi:hypothetical protein
VILKKPHPQIYLFLGESPADLGRPFVRMQEFYESPSKLFRHKFFTLEKFKTWYCKNQSASGRFTYYRDFWGYNLPGDVFLEWATTYAGNESEDEQRLLGMMGALPPKFYVIGAPAKDYATIDHELSHSFWHLYPEYRRRMLAMHEGFDLRAVKRYLKANMYAPDVEADEVTSYVLFDDALLHRAGVSTKALRLLKHSMLEVYREYKTEFIRL